MLRTALPQIVTGTLPGPKAKEIIDRRAAAVPGAIHCAYPVAIETGEGAMIQDVDGNILMDWIGGVGVLNIGFSHPEIIEAVKAQADKYFHGMFNMRGDTQHLTSLKHNAAFRQHNACRALHQVIQHIAEVFFLAHAFTRCKRQQRKVEPSIARKRHARHLTWANIDHLSQRRCGISW